MWIHTAGPNSQFCLNERIQLLLSNDTLLVGVIFMDRSHSTVFTFTEHTKEPTPHINCIWVTAQITSKQYRINNTKIAFQWLSRRPPTLSHITETPHELQWSEPWRKNSQQELALTQKIFVMDERCHTVAAKHFRLYPIKLWPHMKLQCNIYYARLFL